MLAVLAVSLGLTDLTGRLAVVAALVAAVVEFCPA
jgi:hypothetical protein